MAGRLRTPADLLDLRLLHEENDAEWRAWFGEQGIALDAASLAGPRLWHAHVMLDAARSGEGIALANPLLVADHLASGLLVPVTCSGGAFNPVALGGYNFTARDDRWRDPALQRFRLWLRDNASLLERRSDGTDQPLVAARS
ncbi:LysR substrate-binding domain-containing protein [Sphingomonas sp. MMS24-J13]|uniref:LysR substrate-binding domain-containing protein n=1 Tax=Sphingomonas sp. MMS24-J13 TaxID=3238686 RepID=UPI00384FA83D